MAFVRKNLVGLVSVSLLMGGCANMTNFHSISTLKTTDATQSLIDAKQRAIFAVPVTTATGATSLRFCAEPSPDALSAIAGGANASLSVKDQAQAAAALTVAETASNIGLRTQSIQLMRDSMYRLCEQTASGTLSAVQFETLYRHFQNSMVAILAIEQLTGTVRPAAVALSTSAARGSATAVADLTNKAAKAKAASEDAASDASAKAAALTTAQDKAAAYLKDAGAADESGLPADKADGYKPLKQAVLDAMAAKTAADVTATNAKETWAVYQTGLAAIGGGDLSSSGTATTTGGSGSAISETEAQVIATAVQQIVERELGSGFFRETCATLFDQEMAGTLSPMVMSDGTTGSLRSLCGSYANETVEALKAQTVLLTAYARNIDMRTDRGEAISRQEISENGGIFAGGGMQPLKGMLDPAFMANFEAVMKANADRSARKKSAKGKKKTR